MPRRPRVSAADQLVDALAAAATSHAGADQIAKYRFSPAEIGQVMASRRSDMAGTPLSLLQVPTDPHNRISRVWDAYGTDPLFRRMSDRSVEFIANGATWSVNDPQAPNSWLDRIKASPSEQVAKENRFWNTWADDVNLDAPNTLPGLNEVTRWAAKHLLLSGMFVCHYEIGTVKIGSRRYKAPTKISCWPATFISLYRRNTMFMDERVLITNPQTSQALKFNPSSDRIIPYMIQDGQPSGGYSGAGLVPPTGQFYELPLLGKTEGNEGDTECFVLKLNWSPGDLVGIGRQGAIANVGQAVYPLVPFHPLLPQFAIRQKLFAADAAILDGVINFIMQWKIGDKDNKPSLGEKDASGTVIRQSTIEKVKALIQAGRYGQAVEVFLPYWVELDIKTPETATLLNSDKYIQSSLEIMQAFGILFSRSASGSRERMERINLANFEEMLENVRAHIRLFYYQIARRIMQLNGDKLTMTPWWSPQPLNTRSEQFLEQLRELAKIGRVSTTTLMRMHGLDENTENARLAHERATGATDLYDSAVPLSFVQETVNPGGGGPKGKNSPKKQTKVTAIPPTKQQGRPKGGKTVDRNADTD